MCEKGMVWVCVKGPIHSKLNCKKIAWKTEQNVYGIPWVSCAVLCVKDG